MPIWVHMRIYAGSTWNTQKDKRDLPYSPSGRWLLRRALGQPITYSLDMNKHQNKDTHTFNKRDLP